VHNDGLIVSVIFIFAGSFVCDFSVPEGQKYSLRLFFVKTANNYHLNAKFGNYELDVIFYTCILYELEPCTDPSGHGKLAYKTAQARPDRAVQSTGRAMDCMPWRMLHVEGDI
jgi:hypothetical protein